MIKIILFFLVCISFLFADVEGFFKNIVYQYKLSMLKLEVYFIDSDINNTILVYDRDKEDYHSQIMMKIVRTLTNKIDDKYILMVPYKYIKPDSLQEIVNYIQENKPKAKLYINASTSAEFNETRHINENFLKVFTKLSEDEHNITITVASGNTYLIEKKYTDNNETIAINLDKDIWEELNQTINTSYLYKDKKNYLFNDELQKSIEQNIISILKKKTYNIVPEMKNNIIYHYREKLHTYFLMSYLQQEAPRIILVSSHTPYSKEKFKIDGFVKSYYDYIGIKKNLSIQETPSYDNNFTLDCRIDNLIDYKITFRNFGEYYDEVTDRYITGTSISAPIELVERLKKDLNKSKVHDKNK